MLKLPDAARRLPTLANNCYLVGEAKRADIIWTEGDFLALCEHMLNDNPPEHFLSVWIDKESREPQFKKPSFRYRADKRARWAWATVTEKATVLLSAFIPRMQIRNPGGPQLISMLTMESSTERGNGRWKPSSYYCDNHSFTLSFARLVTVITYSSTLANCILSPDGFHY
jgi:hypothetical protein